MRCCVIGGAGFIGSSVVRQLLSTDREVIILGRRVPDATVQLPRVEYVRGDMASRETLKEILPHCDELIDLAYATVPQTSYKDPVFDILGNLPPSVGLLEEAKNAGVKRIVIASSGGTVYGHTKQLPISELAMTNPVSPYGLTKLIIEKYALMFHQLHQLPTIIVRPGNAYGPGQKPFLGQGFIATAIGEILAGKEISIFGPRGTVRDYIHVEDVASGIVAALTSGRVGEIYNIGSGVGRDNLDILDIISSISKKDGYIPVVRHLPSRDFDVTQNVLDSQKLRAHCGWSPSVDITDGLRSTWDALKKLVS